MSEFIALHTAEAEQLFATWAAANPSQVAVVESLSLEEMK